jgi:hypothetical protein
MGQEESFYRFQGVDVGDFFPITTDLACQIRGGNIAGTNRTFPCAEDLRQQHPVGILQTYRQFV